jgi:hypothetical protein
MTWSKPLGGGLRQVASNSAIIIRRRVMAADSGAYGSDIHGSAVNEA